MKKLLLSMLIVLGAIVSTQAQVFDFTCINDVVDNSNDNTFTEIEEGFTADQIAILEFNDFVIVTVRDADSYQRPGIDRFNNPFTQIVQFGSYNYVAPAGTRSGFYPYRVLGALHSQSFYDTAAEVIADLMLIDPSDDADSDGFTNGEEVLLTSYINNDESASPMFMDDVGSYQFYSVTYGYISITRVNNQFEVTNGDGDFNELFDTVQAAIDYILNL